MNEQTSNLDALLTRAREGAPLMTLPEVESLLADAPTSSTPSKGTTSLFIIMISTLISIIALSLFVQFSPSPVEEIEAFPPLHLNEIQLSQLGIELKSDEIRYAAKVPYIGPVEVVFREGNALGTTWRKDYALEKATDWPITDFHLQTVTNQKGKVEYARNDQNAKHLFAVYVPIQIPRPASQNDTLTFWFSPKDALWDVLDPEQAKLYREYANQLLKGGGDDPFVYRPFEIIDALHFEDSILTQLGFHITDTSLYYDAAVPYGERLILDFGEYIQGVKVLPDPNAISQENYLYPLFVSDTLGFQSIRWGLGHEGKEKFSPTYLSKVRHELVAVWIKRDFLKEPYLFWFEANELFLQTIYGSEEAPSGERYATWLKTQHPGLLPSENPIRLSPNPAQNNVRLSMENVKDQSYRWQLLNLQGQVLQTSDWIAPHTEAKLKLGGYSSGVYLVVVRLQNGAQFNTQLLLEN